MKFLFIPLILTCVPICAQDLLSTPRFEDPPTTVTYYQLTHRPKRNVKRLLDRASKRMRNKDLNGAISLLRSALELDRQSWEGHLNLGAAYFWEGDPKSARTEFETAVALDPANPLSYADLAVCQLREGQTESAVLLARQALRFDPLNSLAHRIVATGSRPGK